MGGFTTVPEMTVRWQRLLGDWFHDQDVNVCDLLKAGFRLADELHFVDRLAAVERDARSICNHVAESRAAEPKRSRVRHL